MFKIIKRFNTKSQVTVFIILGIIILAIALLAMFLSSNLDNKAIATESGVNSDVLLESARIKDNVDKCVQTLTDKGVRIMGEQGFYLNIPDFGYNYGNNTAYWLLDTVNIMPDSFAEIERNLSYYVNSNLPSCISFDQFKSEGWYISDFNPSTTTKMYKDDMSVNVKYNLTVKKGSFERNFFESIYIPNIRFRPMYAKAVDFMNNQLLRPDFNFKDPFRNYSKGDYIMDYIQLDKETLLFTISDPKSKLIDSQQFTLKFAASFDINSVPRTYKAGTKVLYSPDRLAVLTFPSGSPASITVRQYDVPSVERVQTPHIKENAEVLEYVDVSFPTSYPVYRFSPKGLDFSRNPAILTIYLNEDQRGASVDYGLLHNGIDGWIPFPNIKGDGTITTFVYGFK